MFTRAVDIHTKPGKARELSTTVNDKVLPILKKQPGFVDEITLVSNTSPDRMLALSFWESEEQAQRYHHEQVHKINDMVAPLLQTSPKVETFNVDISTIQKIKSRAA